jgi:hypothetical protein
MGKPRAGRNADLGAHRLAGLSLAGDLVAMVRCNNGASELNAWAGLFAEFAQALGVETDTSTIFATLFTSALNGAPDGGGLNQICDHES